MSPSLNESQDVATDASQMRPRLLTLVTSDFVVSDEMYWEEGNPSWSLLCVYGGDQFVEGQVV